MQRMHRVIDDIDREGKAELKKKQGEERIAHIAVNLALKQ